MGSARVLYFFLIWASVSGIGLGQDDVRAPVSSPVPQALAVPGEPVRLPPVPVPDPAAGSRGPARAMGEGVTPADVLPQPPLTLDEAQRLAQQFNPTLAQAQLAVRSASGEQLQAGLYLNPEVGYYGADMGLEQTSGQQGAYVAQEFITARKRQLAEATAGHAVLAARHALEAQYWRVMNSVRGNFFDVLIAQQTVGINEELLRVARHAEDITARSRALKEVTEADVLQASIEAEQAEIGLFQARNRHRTAWFQLAYVVGRPDLPYAPLAGDVLQDLPVIRWDEGLQRLMSLSPELAQAQARLEQARCNLAWQNAQRRANFAIQVGVKYDESVRDTLTDAQLSMPLQLFDRNQGNIQAAQADFAAARREVERVELDLRNRFAAAFEDYSNARYQVNLFRTSIIDKAQKSLELTAIGYREGEFSFLSLLTAQRTFFAVNLEYLSSLQSLWAQSVALDGYLLMGGLDRLP